MWFGDIVKILADDCYKGEFGVIICITEGCVILEMSDGTEEIYDDADVVLEKKMRTK